MDSIKPDRIIIHLGRTKIHLNKITLSETHRKVKTIIKEEIRETLSEGQMIRETGRAAAIHSNGRAGASKIKF